MANSERSFSDRLQKARSLSAATALMAPAFQPADVSLGVIPFATHLDSLATAIDDVALALTAFSDAVQLRISDTDKAQSLCTQIVSYVKSNAAWKLQFPRIKQLADKVRLIKQPRKTLPPPAPEPGEPTPPPVKQRDRGDGSYVEIEANFRALIAAAAGLAGYAPPDAGIQSATLASLALSLTEDNASIVTTDQALDDAQRARYALFYEPESGLADKFQAIKNAVKGQYGQTSTAWASVKGMRW
jgi:hypothetical protein